MPREILSETAGKPYSRGTRNGNLVFVSGQMDANDKEIPGGVGPQMVQTMEYIKEILAEAGATLDDVSNMPARATVGISQLAFDLKVVRRSRRPLESVLQQMSGVESIINGS